MKACGQRLNGALSSLISFKMSLLIAMVLDLMIFKGPFQPEQFCDYGHIQR